MVAGEREIESKEPIKVSARRTADAYKLATGEVVVVTEKSNVERPAGVDGVLLRQTGKIDRWLSHKVLDAFRVEEKKDPEAARGEIEKGWIGSLAFRAETLDGMGEVKRKGLRPPQIGGLHAIGSHWSLYAQPATVVMPTGTGKTETMLAALPAYQPGPVVVVVPSEILREQTANKFATFGLLRELGVLDPSVRNPIVGIIKHRPKSHADLDIFDRCNVVVTTMSSIAEGTAEKFIPVIANKTGALIVDEAHHIAASGWSHFRSHFSHRRVLQFTATPYRRDGKLVDGKVIFEYPLHMAQKDGYFKRINFVPVYELDQDEADVAIADEALAALRKDLKAGRDHLLMARCDRIEHGQAILAVYEKAAADLNPDLVHSKSSESPAALEAVRNRTSRVVIAVNMLGEGFDLPQLKVAAVHDTHKSLAVLLQFTGRFTRSAAKNIGDATVVANIADQNVSSALERLYSEDADWNQLLSEMSSAAAKTHMALVEFLNASRRLDEPSDDDDKVEISHHLLRPMFNTWMYAAEKFAPAKFFEGVPSGTVVHRVWLHDKSNTLYFVTRSEPSIKWTRSRELRDRQWDLYVLHFDPDQKLLYVSSSDKDHMPGGVAEAVGATNLVTGDVIFRSLGRINRLVFQNVGVRKHGRRNLRFAMYTGSDVAEALSISEKAGSVKSNVSGTGWENGEQVAVGCSYKGRVWTREPGTVPDFVKWCTRIGGKILDDTIDTKDIIKNVLIPKEVDALPDKAILSVEWPLEILRQMEERVVLSRDGKELPLLLCDLELVAADAKTSTVHFWVKVSTGDVWSDLTMTIGGEHGYRFEDAATPAAEITIGKVSATIANFLNDYPPLIRFVDLTELDGNILLEPQQSNLETYPSDRFETWDWTGTDLNKESLWKDGVERPKSIQWRAAQRYLGLKFDVVFDDDKPGEAADLVCIKEETDHIRLSLVHCKFTKGKTAGERVVDVQEVCAQAVRSGKWKGQFVDLSKHVIGRERRLVELGRSTRFLRGDVALLNQLARASRFKEIRLEVVIVQPGLSKKDHTPDQARVLGAADSYLKETVGVELDVISSA
jgi:superfamily II DNA or RNA helicase